MEYLQSAGKIELYHFMLPLLDGEGRPEVLTDLPALLKRGLQGKDEWIRACTLSLLAQTACFELKPEVEKLLDSQKDLYSQEMALYCLERWQNA